ncbi:ADP-ribosylation factor-related protein 1 [Hordeum vulgare]|nr:ADP-ribosylation factor-related protein 1 [Hordeum vulgare]
MGLRNYGRKGKHDREAGSSSGRRRGSVKEEAASPPCRASAPAPFTISPRPTSQRDRQYLSAVHLSADRVPIPPVPTSSRARRDEIWRRRRLLSDDLYYDDMYAPDSVLWDTWLRDEHDVRRASYFADTVSGPRQPCREVRGRTRVRGLTPTPSPSPSPSPPPRPRVTAQEEARLMQRVMEDSMITHDERQWPGLEDVMALSAADDVAIPELMEAEEVMEDVRWLRSTRIWWASSGAGRAQLRRWRTQWRRELVPHVAAVTRSGCLATGGGGAGTCQLPARPRAPRAAGPPLDAAGLRRPRRRRRRHRRPLNTATTTTSTGV